MIVYKVNSDGFIEETYDSRIGFEVENPELIITKGWDKRLFMPKFDFKLGEWVEGLTESEVEEKENEILNQQNRPSESNMNALAILELAVEIEKIKEGMK